MGAMSNKAFKAYPPKRLEQLWRSMWESKSGGITWSVSEYSDRVCWMGIPGLGPANPPNPWGVA